MRAGFDTTVQRLCSVTCCTTAGSTPHTQQLPVFEAAMQFAKTEGIIPAPESAHAIKGATVTKQRPPARGQNA